MTCVFRDCDDEATHGSIVYVGRVPVVLKLCQPDAEWLSGERRRREWGAPKVEVRKVER